MKKNWMPAACLLLLLASCAGRRQGSQGAMGGGASNGNSVGAARPDSTLGILIKPGANTALLKVMRQWKGTPYKLGGNTRSGVDCSGLIALIYPQVYAVQAPRTTALLFAQAQPIPREQLLEGDLVFFTIGTPKPGHAGIYLWDDYFFHASTSRGVIISRLTEPYWSRYFTGGGRLAATKSKP